MMNGNTAIVTGGAGFIGSSLVDRLLATGNNVVVIDNLTTGHLSNLNESRKYGEERLRFEQLDVRSREVTEVIADLKPETVFHLAAQVEVGKANLKPFSTYETNIRGTYTLLEFDLD